MDNWKDKTCKECFFRIEWGCFRFPGNIRPIVARDNDWFEKACAEWKKDRPSGWENFKKAKSRDD